MIKQKILNEAIKKFGAEEQLNVLVEEMSELTKEICKFKRGEDNLDRISEEMADVYIMLAQAVIIFNNEEHIDDWVDTKIDRLFYRISKDGTK